MAEKTSTLDVDGKRVHVVLGWNLVWTAAGDFEECPRSMVELRKLAESKASANPQLADRHKLYSVRLGRGSSWSCESVGSSSFKVREKCLSRILSQEPRDPEERVVQFSADSEKERDLWVSAIRARIEAWPDILRCSARTSAEKGVQELLKALATQKVDENDADADDIPAVDGHKPDHAPENIVNTSERLAGETDLLQAVLDDLNISSDALEGMLRRSPLARAAVPTLILLLRDASCLARSKAEDRVHSKIVAKSRNILLLAFRELRYLRVRKEGEEEYVEDVVVQVIHKIEDLMQDFEQHMNGLVPRRSLNADTLCTLLSELDQAGEHLRNIGAAGNVAPRNASVCGSGENAEKLSKKSEDLSRPKSSGEIALAAQDLTETMIKGSSASETVQTSIGDQESLGTPDNTKRIVEYRRISNSEAPRSNDCQSLCSKGQKIWNCCVLCYCTKEGGESK